MFWGPPQRSDRARGPPLSSLLRAKPWQETLQGSLKAGLPEEGEEEHQGRLCPPLPLLRDAAPSWGVATGEPGIPGDSLSWQSSPESDHEGHHGAQTLALLCPSGKFLEPQQPCEQPVVPVLQGHWWGGSMGWCRKCLAEGRAHGRCGVRATSRACPGGPPLVQWEHDSEPSA